MGQSPIKNARQWRKARERKSRLDNIERGKHADRAPAPFRSERPTVLPVSTIHDILSNIGERRQRTSRRRSRVQQIMSDAGLNRTVSREVRQHYKNIEPAKLTPEQIQQQKIMAQGNPVMEESREQISPLKWNERPKSGWTRV